MKYLLIGLLMVVSLLGGYWYGYAVGFTESRILNIGGSALDEIDAVKELEFNPDVNAKDIHEARINEAIIDYGEYLEKEEFFALPIFYSAKPAIYSQLDQLISYRKSNPRTLNGQIYSPFPPGYKSKQSFKNLDAGSKEKFLQEEEHYKRAMEQ